RRVLAEQRALRAAQHFDALDVDEVDRRGRRTRVQNAVDVETHAGLDTVVGETVRLTETADVDARVARVRRENLHGRHQVLQTRDVERTRVDERVAAQRGNGNGHVLCRFFATTRAGHRNDFDVATHVD